MNLLIDPLPETVTVAGEQWPIRTSFRFGVLFEQLMGDGTLTGEEKIFQALDLYYPACPPDLEGAVEALLWFYRCGEDQEREDRSGGLAGHRARAYDFDQDAALIYAAFRQCYGLDLTAEEPHWWSFRALFTALPEDCRLSAVMGYRTADTKGMSREQKKFYAKMKKLCALKTGADPAAALSLAERDRRMLAYVDQRFAEVEEARKGGDQTP